MCLVNLHLSVHLDLVGVSGLLDLELHLKFGGLRATYSLTSVSAEKMVEMVVSQLITNRLNNQSTTNLMLVKLFYHS